MTNWNVVAFGRQHGCQIAIGTGVNFNRAFVGFDLEQYFVFDHLVTWGLAPCDKQTGVLRHAKRGHDDSMAIRQVAVTVVGGRGGVIWRRRDLGRG